MELMINFKITEMDEGEILLENREERYHRCPAGGVVHEVPVFVHVPGGVE
jgi:hypothetical protein